MATRRRPVIGHSHRLLWDMPALLDENRKALGPWFRIDMFGDDMLVVSDAAALALLRNHEVASDILEAKAGPVLEGTLLGLDGPPHRRIRGAMHGPFQPPGLTAAQVGALVARQTQARLEQWASARAVRVVDQTRSWALDIMFQLIGCPAQAVDLWAKQYRALLFGGGRLPGLLGRPSARARAWIDARLRELVLAQRRDGTRDTMLGALSNATDEAGQLLTMEALLPNLRVLVLGGHETSASVLSWCFLELADHPTLWSELCDEARSRSQPPTTPAELGELPHAMGFVREMLRLHVPTSLLSRRTIEPLSIGGHSIPVGAGLAIPLLTINRDPELFAEPDRIRPERWQGPGAPSGSSLIAPFGGGPHTCLGYHLALLEITHFVVAAARHMGALGLRPSRRGLPHPRSTWFPLAHPKLDTMLWWE
jgi:cytochrome P450